MSSSWYSNLGISVFAGAFCRFFSVESGMVRLQYVEVGWIIMLPMYPLKPFVAGNCSYVGIAANDIGAGQEPKILLRQIYQKLSKVYSVLDGHLWGD